MDAIWINCLSGTDHIRLQTSVE